MVRPQPRWIARWAVGVALVGLIAAVTHPKPEAPLSLTAGDVDRPVHLDQLGTATTDPDAADSATSESSTTVPDRVEPTTSTTRRSTGTPTPTATTVPTGIEQPGEPPLGPVGLPAPAPTVPTYPRTWQTPVGAEMPVISCGQGFTAWRCYPAVWPPPELDHDPCSVPSPWNAHAGRELTGGLGGAVSTEQATEHGYAPDANYIALGWTGTDCLWHEFEGIRFIQVEWHGPTVGRVSATIDWGDGTRTTANPRSPGCPSTDNWGGSAHEYAHKYAAAGTYTTTITVTGGQCEGVGVMTDVETLVFTLTSPVYERYVIR